MKAKMKKWMSCLLTAVLVLAMTVSLVPQRAEAAGASLSGSGSLRAGSTVTLTFSVSGSGIVALQGALSYDSSQLEFIGMDQLIGGSWGVEMSGSTVIADDAKLANPINGSASILAVTFRVKSGVSAGSTVSASITGISGSDGNSDFSLGSAYWSADILKPLSSNAKLSSLSCSNATLSPSFSADTTYYSTTVPYDVTSLSLSYDTADSGADAYVSGNDLGVGSNTVTVSVEAEDGTTKYYTIEVTREQDPNYVPASDANLEKLKVSSGKLSPAFSPDVTNYVVYVPFETEEFTVEGTAHDSKAVGVTDKTAKLVDGDNELTVVCTAEDGTTTKSYTVHVYRMPAYQGVLPTITAPDAEAVANANKDPETTFTIPASLTLPYLGEVPIYYVAGAALLVLLVLFYVIGTLVGRAVGKKKALKAAALPTEEPVSAPETPAVAEEMLAEKPTSLPEEAPTPAPEEAPAPKEVPAAETPIEEPVAEPAAEAEPSIPQEPSDMDPQEVSLDELLEDIRNM